MGLVMVSRQTDKRAFAQRMGIRAIEEGQEIHVALLRLHALHLLINHSVKAAALRNLLILHTILQEPFQIAGGGGAALLHQIIARHCKERIHSNTSIHNRLFGNVFVNTPCSRNGAQLLR